MGCLLINPSDYQDVINSCYEKKMTNRFCHSMCTAFGDVFAYVKNPRLNNYVVYLNVRYGTYLILPANLRCNFNKVMVKSKFLERLVWLRKVSCNTREKLGTPDNDECFWYSLLLAKDEDIENIKDSQDFRTLTSAHKQSVNLKLQINIEYRTLVDNNAG